MRRIASCSMEWGGTPWRRRQLETWSDHRDDNNDYDGDKDDGDDGDARMQECWSDAHIYLFSCLWMSCDVWQEMNKNFLEHNIKKLLSSDWGIECNSPFRHVFRCIVSVANFSSEIQPQNRNNFSHSLTPEFMKAGGSSPTFCTNRLEPILLLHG